MPPNQYYDLIARMHGYAAEYNLQQEKRVVKTFLVVMSDILIVI